MAICSCSRPWVPFNEDKPGDLAPSPESAVSPTSLRGRLRVHTGAHSMRPETVLCTLFLGLALAAKDTAGGCCSHTFSTCNWVLVVLATLCNSTVGWLRLAQAEGPPAYQALCSVMLRNSFGARAGSCACITCPSLLALTCLCRHRRRRPLPGAAPAFGGKHVLLFITDQVGR